MSNAKHSADKHGRDSKKAVGIGSAGIAKRVTEQLEANPLLLVAGGVALGAVAGALLPRSDQERQLLAPVGQRIGGAVTAAMSAGREAGLAQLDELGLTPDAARGHVRTLVDGLSKAATTAGSAAAQAAADGARQPS